MTFEEQERARQVTFKENYERYSDQVRQDGIYLPTRKKYPFVLPVEYNYENLYWRIRDECISYFQNNHIRFHGAVDRGPSNHMCDSQVACLNMLYPLVKRPEALKQLLSGTFDVAEVLSIHPDVSDRYVDFEWSNPKLIDEPSSRTGVRGAYATSPDAFIKFRTPEGYIHVLLIEWKYTERATKKKFNERRYNRYIAFYHAHPRLSMHGEKFFKTCLTIEPLYQLLRLQLLAWEMERNNVEGSDIVSVLLVHPEGNTAIRGIPFAKQLGTGAENALELWKQIAGDRFQAVSWERLLGGFCRNDSPELASWAHYVSRRYGITLR